MFLVKSGYHAPCSIKRSHLSTNSGKLEAGFKLQPLTNEVLMILVFDSDLLVEELRDKL
jgi:hypothetical protein